MSLGATEALFDVPGTENNIYRAVGAAANSVYTSLKNKNPAEIPKDVLFPGGDLTFEIRNHDLGKVSKLVFPESIIRQKCFQADSNLTFDQHIQGATNNVVRDSMYPSHAVQALEIILRHLEEAAPDFIMPLPTCVPIPTAYWIGYYYKRLGHPQPITEKAMSDWLDVLLMGASLSLEELILMGGAAAYMKSTLIRAHVHSTFRSLRSGPYPEVRGTAGGQWADGNGKLLSHRCPVHLANEEDRKRMEKFFTVPDENDNLTGNWME